MADLSITASTVLVSSGPTSKLELGAGVTGTQGLVMSESASTLVKASNTTAALAAYVGMLISAGSPGQPVVYAQPGAVVAFTSTPALVVGEVYVVSVTGFISPIGDYTTGDFLGIVGICQASGTLTLTQLTSGVARA